MFTFRPCRNLHHSAVENADRHSEQRYSDERHGQRLILAVPIVMRLVLWLSADTHKNEYNDIGHEVAERVHCIGHHRSTMTCDARHELKEQQYHVHRTTHQRHPIDALLPMAVLMAVFVSFHLLVVSVCKGNAKK